MKKLFFIFLLCAVASQNSLLCVETTTIYDDPDDSFFEELARVAQQPADESDAEIAALVDALAAEKIEAVQASWFNRYCTPYLVTLFLYYQRCKKAAHDYWASLFNTPGV